MNSAFTPPSGEAEGQGGARGSGGGLPPVRIGHGYDLHRLEPPVGGAGSGSGAGGQGVRPLVIGGVPIEHDRGPVGHSDGDVLLHAVTDAILGALGLPDIGQLFPDTDPKWEGAASEVFVREAVRQMRERGWGVGNVDATVVLERPKLSPHKERIRENLAGLLGVGRDQASLKAKTHERVDAVGEGRAIEAHVVVLLVRV